MADRPDPREVVLVHGAWLGAWIWQGVIPRLEAAGWTCHAVDLPGNGAERAAAPSFDTHRAHLARVIEYCHRPVHVVAHGGGGAIASQIAEDLPDDVVQVVYVSGTMLPSGVSFPELLAPVAAADPRALGLGAHLEAVPGGTRVPEAAARELLFHDCAPEVARSAAARMTVWPEAVQAPRPRLTGRFLRARRTYVECLADRSIVLPVQRAMQARTPGAETVSLPSGHAPMLSMPERLADTLLACLAA